MCDNFYNPRKNLFTNTYDAILIRDYFRSGSGQANSQISTLQILTITPPPHIRYVAASGTLLAIYADMNFTQHSRAATCNKA